jgi:serine/threonine protein kinase
MRVAIKATLAAKCGVSADKITLVITAARRLQRHRHQRRHLSSGIGVNVAYTVQVESMVAAEHCNAALAAIASGGDTTMLSFLAELKASAPDGTFASVDSITVATPAVKSFTGTTTGTTSGDESAPSASLPIGAIGGGVGGFVVIAIIVVVLWILRRNNAANKAPNGGTSATSPRANSSDEHGFELTANPMRNRSKSVGFDGDDSEALAPPLWSVADVTAPNSPVTDSDIAKFILSYSASKQVFRDRYHLPNNLDKLLGRGRKSLNEYYSEIERAYSPFLPTEEFERRRDECKEMERDCNEETSHQLGVKCIAQMEETLQRLCVRNALPRGKGNGMGGFAKSLIDNGRISKLLSIQLHEVAQFRNKVIGHDSVGSGQGVKIRPAKTREFLRMYRDLLNESARLHAKSEGGRQQRSASINRFAVKPREILFEADPKGLNGKRVLGTGGFSTVLMCHFRGEAMAYKQFDMHGAPELSDAMVDEINIMVCLPQHPNIASVRGVCLKAEQVDGGDVPFGPGYMLDYSSRGSFKSILDDGATPLPWKARMSVVKQICDGMSFLHNQQPHPIFHCDLKAANLLVYSADDAGADAGTYRIRIADFGLSVIKAETTVHASTRGGFKGSILWSSPNRLVRGLAFTAADDLFSFAMTVLEIITRKLPWDGMAELAVVGCLNRHFKVSQKKLKRGESEEDQRLDWLDDNPLSERRPSLKGIEEGCPGELRDIVTTCWSDDVNNRSSFKILAAKLGGMGVGAAVADWETKFDDTAAWSVEHHNFKPCGFDMATKHIHGGLRGLEDKVRMGPDAGRSWSDDDTGLVNHFLEEAEAYLHMRMGETANNVDLLTDVVEKLQLEFISIYDAVGKRIAKERGYAEAIALFLRLQCTIQGSMRQSVNDLLQLYIAAAEIKPRFDSELEKIAKASKGVFKTSSLKHLFRTLEKAAVRHSTDKNLGRADNVYDIVRCMIEYKTMEDMAAGVRALQECEDVNVLRVKDRFSDPTPGGWMDVMASVEINGDRNKYVCEVQFVHKSLLVVRKGMGGHDEYAVYRSAVELLEAHGSGSCGADEEKGGDVDEDVAKGTVMCMVENAKSRSASVEFAM